MAYDENKISNMQNIILENRNKLHLTGILDVLNFDEEIITLDTEMRNINYKRSRFKIE